VACTLLRGKRDGIRGTRLGGITFQNIDGVDLLACDTQTIGAPPTCTPGAPGCGWQSSKNRISSSSCAAASRSPSSVELALALEHPVYDCLYLAAAVESVGPAAHRQQGRIDKARSLNHYDHIN